MERELRCALLRQRVRVRTKRRKRLLLTCIPKRFKFISALCPGGLRSTSANAPVRSSVAHLTQTLWGVGGCTGTLLLTVGAVAGNAGRTSEDDSNRWTL